jgi:hypothetical protein
MGLTLKFLAGDEHVLTEVFRGEEWYKYDVTNPDAVLAEADFSLHLQPRDLNFLSIEVGGITGAEPMDLRSHLSLGVDEKHRGLLRVSKAWVAYFAAVSEDSGPILAERWATKLRDFYQQPRIVVTDSMIRAINDLIVLCKQALPEQVPVVHVWWL